MTQNNKTHQVHILLGGGGIKGLSHLGFLRAIEELQIKAKTITGVSIGSILAALATNGYPIDELDRIFQAELNSLDPSKFTRSLLVPQVVERLLFQSKPFSLREFMEALVARYNLRPNPALRIVTLDVFTGKPYVYEGENYNLAEALTASCALPYLFRPVIRDGHYFIDGGIYHPNPGNVGPGTCLISKLGYAKTAPRDKLTSGDSLMHNFERYTKPLVVHRMPDPEGHLVLDISDPSVATMTFGLSEATKQGLIDVAYTKTYQALRQALDDGSFEEMFGSKHD